MGGGRGEGQEEEKIVHAAAQAARSNLSELEMRTQSGRFGAVAGLQADRRLAHAHVAVISQPSNCNRRKVALCLVQRRIDNGKGFIKP